MLKFKNVADYAMKYDYLVFRADEDDIMTKWFYGAWNDRNTANEVALEVGGETWETEKIRDLCEINVGGW